MEYDVQDTRPISAAEALRGVEAVKKNWSAHDQAWLRELPADEAAVVLLLAGELGAVPVEEDPEQVASEPPSKPPSEPSHQASFFDKEPEEPEPVHDIPHARTTDPWTSQASSSEVEQTEGSTSVLKPGTKKHIVLQMISRVPMTGAEVSREGGNQHLEKRVSDLKNALLVEAVGSRTDPVSLRPGIIYELNDRGRDVLSQLDAGETVEL